jgi:hypothetical protein
MSPTHWLEQVSKLLVITEPHTPTRALQNGAQTLAGASVVPPEPIPPVARRPPVVVTVPPVAGGCPPVAGAPPVTAGLPPVVAGFPPLVMVTRPPEADAAPKDPPTPDAMPPLPNGSSKFGSPSVRPPQATTHTTVRHTARTPRRIAEPGSMATAGAVSALF